MTGNVRISLPESAKRGEIVRIKTLISHPMHNGFRSDSRGERIQRDIITTFTCHYADRLVFRAELQPGIAANPYLTFSAKIDVSGEFRFTWTDQHGKVVEETRNLAADV